MNNNKPVISIITVVFNSESLIEKTIRSIINQTYPNIEYIVIDGASIDGTIDKIEKYRKHIAVFISEPDKGIYDAMNKGIKCSKGHFVMFINSGDMLYDKSTLENVFALHEPKNRIYYGHTMIIDKNGRQIGERRLRPLKKTHWTDLINGMLICHQSIIVSRKIAPLYDTKYRYSADYNWVLAVMKKAGNKVVNTNCYLSQFLDGGQSKKTILRSLYERFIIMEKYFGFWPTVAQHFAIAFRFITFLFMHRRF